MVSSDPAYRDKRHMAGGCPCGRGPHRLQANRGVTGRLGDCAEDRAHRDVVNRLAQCLIELIERVGRYADDGIVPDDGAGLCRCQIFLSDVHARRPGESRDIGAIVHDDCRASRRRASDDRRCRGQEVAAAEILAPDLQQAGAAGQAR